MFQLIVKLFFFLTSLSQIDYTLLILELKWSLFYSEKDD